MLVSLNEENKILGWYDPILSENIPEDVIEINDELHQKAVSIFATHYIDGVFSNNEDIYLFKVELSTNHITDDVLLDLSPIEVKKLLKDFNNESKVVLLDRKKKLVENYLSTTDWVEWYHIKHLMKLELIPEDSNKWTIINNRLKHREYLKTL